MAPATKSASPTTGGTRRAPAKTKSGGGAGKHRGGAAVEGRAKKAAAAEVAGGGPEDPIADVAAASALKGGGDKKKSAPREFKPSEKDSTSKVRIGGKSPVLLAEFVICFVILGLGTLASPKGSANSGIPRLMLKSSALAGVFLVLSLAASVGGKAQKTAAALGGLVTVTYVVAGPDAIALFSWATKYFGGSKAQAEASGAEAAAGAEAGAETGMTGASQ